jgi:demethylspheroidene O-methyltransferase
VAAGFIPVQHPASSPGGAAKASLRERFLGWRNRLLVSPQFQAFAARNPLTAMIARRKADRLFTMATGFAYARILYACVALDLFARLQAGTMPLSVLAADCGLETGPMRTLLKAAASLDLIEDLGGDRFALGELGASVLGNPGLAGMIAHHSVLYRDLADPVALLQRPRGSAELAQVWPYATGEADEGKDAAQAYSRLMGETQAMISGLILDAVDLSATRRLMDVGGGNGAFLAAALARHGQLCGHLVDLPDVAGLATQRFAQAGLGARTQVTGLSFLTGTLPSGADAISFVRVLHDHDDGAVMTALRAARAALAPGGQLIVAEPLAETPGARAMGHGYFGLYLHAMGSGRPRTRAELSAMAQAAGFPPLRERASAIPLLVRVLVAAA